MTFPADESQGPATKPHQYPGAPSPTGAVGLAHYDEGLQIGYRYWDAHGQTPLFPFGHGLSYSRFDVRTLAVRPRPDGGAEVQAEVRNTGARAGAEVVQVYLGFPESAGEPPRQLKAFRKVRLQPGQAETVTIGLEPDAFLYWDDGRKTWTRAQGDYRVMVGRSSRDIAFSGKAPAAP